MNANPTSRSRRKPAATPVETAAPAGEPAEARIAAVRRFNRFFTGRIGVLGETLADSPFTLGEARVLYEVTHRDRPTTTELSQALGLDAGYLSRMLSTFARKGLVVRDRSAVDGRQWHIRITKKGEKMFAPVNQRTRDDVVAMLQALSAPEQRHLIDAMQQIERLLAPHDAAAAPPSASAVLLRPHQPGDMGWIVHRQAEFYHDSFGWNEEYEALIAEIVAKFLREFDPAWERCWIAEQDGEPVGSVFVVRKSPKVAQLRLLFVEPRTQGHGLGRRLVDECIRFSRLKKYETLTLWTNDLLVSARRIYEAAGFQLVKEERSVLFGTKQNMQHWDLVL